MRTSMLLLLVLTGCKLECSNLPVHETLVKVHVTEPCPVPSPTPEEKSACEYEVESLRDELRRYESVY